jgi:hypothetical protein
MHGLGRGRWKRAAFLILPAKGILHRQVGIPSGTSLAAYFTLLVMGPNSTTQGKCKSKVTKGLEDEFGTEVGGTGTGKSDVL